MKHLLSVFLFLAYLPASIIHVPEDVETIQGAIDMAVEGDTVLVEQGIYYENLLLESEITLASHAILDDLDSDWLNNEHINNTIISGAQTPANSYMGSCLVIKNGNISPTVTGFTFQDGIGTAMRVSDCAVSGDVSRKEKSGGAILMYKAYPVIKYNRFLNNGSTSQNDQGHDEDPVTNGGAMSHYNAEEVEFDEDRLNQNENNSNSSRDVPGVMDIQFNYFENNGSGDGENFYSYGFDGSIDISNSVFDNIDCDANQVNEFVLNSKTNSAEYLQNNIGGNCIEDDTYFVHAGIGSDSNPGSEEEPFLTIRKALSLAKENGLTTFIHVGDGIYSPSTTGEVFPLTIPDHVYLIGESWENTVIDVEASPEKQARGFIVREVEDVVIANFTITGGSAENAGCQGGGAISLQNDDDAVWNSDGSWASFDSSNVLLENLYLIGNHAYNGGGIGVFRLIGPVINNVIVENNTAKTHGGGIFHHAGVTLISNSVIRGNSTQSMHGGGLSIYVTNGQPSTLTNVEITNNSAEFWGGAAMFFEAYILAANLTVSNNTDNSETSVITNMGGYLGIGNSIIWNNSPNVIDSDLASTGIQYSNIPAGTSTGGGFLGNIFDVDPVYTDSESNDFTLDRYSPCVDAGASDLSSETYEYIIEDYFGLAPDMGAYEFRLPSPTEFTFDIESNNLTLSWDPSTYDDFQYYGVQVSTDLLYESNVTEYFTPDNHYTFSGLEYNTPYYFRVATMYGQGEWSDYSDIVTTSIEFVSTDEQNIKVPFSFALSQNYPNPFNPSTNISYALPEKNSVSLNIYDVNGSLVRNLVNEKSEPGFYTVSWDGTNVYGSKVSAGMYFYKIQSGSFVSTQKMIFLK